MAKCYPALVEQGRQGFGVYFPDLPGCTSGGNSVEEAIRNAHEALTLHINGMIEDDIPLPEASPFNRVDAGAEGLIAAVVLICGSD